MADLLREWGYEVETAPDGSGALDKVLAFNPAVVISDLLMPRMGGMDLLKQLRNTRPGLGFIMLTAQGSIEKAFEAAKLGAFSFLEKPLVAERLHRLQLDLRNSLERHENVRQLEIAQRHLRDAGRVGCLVGQSERIHEVMSLIAMLAPSRASVLIRGER